MRGEHPITVLLIDDQPVVGEAVRRILAAEPSIRFHYCRDASSGISTALGVSPTVILQDLVMPDLDGITLVKFFRKHRLTAYVPILLLTSEEDARHKVEAFAQGANDYLIKLPHPLELIARVRYHSLAYIAQLERNEAYQALELRNAFIRGVFGRYVSDEVVQSVLDAPRWELGGELREVTILIADLRGFTRLSEELGPPQVVTLINNFLEVMTDVVMRHGGTIDELLGDALLVIFGAPVVQPDHARRAAACAIEMQLAMAAVNERNAGAGLPAVEMGIGLNTGEVVAGNIGSHKRAKYGVVGSHVNLTARIESATVGGQILMSAQTHAEAGADVQVGRVIDLEAKGFAQRVTVYELHGLGGIELPPRDALLIPLAHAVPVRLTILDGVHVGGRTLAGRILRIAAHDLEVELDETVDDLTDLVLRLDAEGAPAAPFYGKVVVGSAPESPLRAVRVTSAPREVMTYLARLSSG